MTIDSFAVELIRIDPLRILFPYALAVIVAGIVSHEILRRRNKKEWVRCLNIGIKLFGCLLALLIVISFLSFKIVRRIREDTFLSIANQNKVSLTVHTEAEDSNWNPPISTEFLQIIAEAQRVKAHHSHSLPLLSFDVSDLSLGKTHWYRVGRDSEHENEYWLVEITENREFGQPMHRFQSKELTSFLEVRGILEPSQNGDEG